MRNKYGYVDEKNREYVIIRPDTPTPWINYLGSGDYGGIISNTGGGYSFFKDPRNFRVLRYRYNSIPYDQPGRYIYLRDEDGDYWSPTWQPITSKILDNYECRHGTGYTIISSSYKNIYVSILYFIPIDPIDNECPCELWVLKIKNNREKPCSLISFSYCEFSYYDAIIDQQNLDWGQQIFRSKYDEKEKIILASTQFRPTTTFFSSNLPPIGYDTDREIFVGRYRSLSNPIVVEMGKSLNSLAPRGNNIGSLSHKIDLYPNEEITIIYILGVTNERERIFHVVRYYRSLENIQKAFETLKKDWDEYLNRFTIKTPDEKMNVMLNLFNPIQCRTTLYWSRFVSYYDTGLGRGMGTRDSAQDTLGTVHNYPDYVRKLLLKLWRLQFKDGHTWHLFFPLTGEGGPGHAAEFPNWPQWFSDDHLWLIIATCAYLRETGDFSILDEVIPYQDNGSDTLWNHIQKAIEFTLNNLGPHGLPRMGFADWDDTLNLDHGSGKSESVWTAMQFCKVMLDLIDLCNILEKKDDEEKFKALYNKMVENIENSSWNDEGWYTRAFDDEGNPVGSPGRKYHEINLITQTWSAIAGLRKDRVLKALENAHKILNTEYGLRLMYPPYEESDPMARGTSTFPPGAKENGGIFCHANTWAIISACILGLADLAYQYYLEILPLDKDPDILKTEPYVYCQNICAPEHPHYGQGRNSWLTGTAAWAYVSATQYILGIRPTFKGLQISPVIPENWNGFSAKRIFRGVTYNISVERIGIGNEISSIEVDGKKIESNIIPFPDKNIKEVNVKVFLGKR